VKNDERDLTEAIQQRAYELFEERGYEAGHDQEDWFRAEAEVLALEVNVGHSKAPATGAPSAPEGIRALKKTSAA
jgi:hypothetical protein